MQIYSVKIKTPLGTMIAIASDNHLLLLEFEDAECLGPEIEKISQEVCTSIITKKNNVLKSLESELKLYFAKKLKRFKTPIKFIGTDFQSSAWRALQKIPFGKTRSYKDQALKIGKPTATRAVANANGANKIAIVVPCHRIINSNGGLGGYAGGVNRKKWLLEHEKGAI